MRRHIYIEFFFLKLHGKTRKVKIFTMEAIDKILGDTHQRVKKLLSTGRRPDVVRVENTLIKSCADIMKYVDEMTKNYQKNICITTPTNLYPCKQMIMNGVTIGMHVSVDYDNIVCDGVIVKIGDIERNGRRKASNSGFNLLSSHLITNQLLLKE